MNCCSWVGYWLLQAGWRDGGGGVDGGMNGRMKGGVDEGMDG